MNALWFSKRFHKTEFAVTNMKSSPTLHTVRFTENASSNILNNKEK